MTSSRPQNDSSVDPDSAAAAWLAKLQGGSAERQAFDDWLAQSPTNREAWARAQRLWSGLALVEDDPAVAALRREARLAMQTARPRLIDQPWLRRAAAASAAIVLLGGALGGWFWLSPPARPEASSAQTFTTAVGQRASYRLADGSVVTLNTDSKVEVGHWGRERPVRLARGQAYFQVAKDAKRPFIVSAGRDRVTAVGTAFDVRFEPERLAVTLVEGRVRIAGPTSNGERTVELTAGSQFLADARANWQVSEVDTAHAASWLRGQLVFDAQPLSAVVAEMNRFSTRKLRIADPALARTPISGVFQTGEVDAFAKALQDYGLARVSGPTDREVALVRP
jgi:transmembrane sensor